MNTLSIPQRLTTLADVLTACETHRELAPYARLVGKWVWLEFDHKPTLEVRAYVKAIGFRWNAERLAWQHSCGTFCRQNRRIDPRSYYGCEPVSCATRDRELEREAV